MPLFEYTASDRSGTISKGQVEAKDKTSASRGLAQRGLFVLEVKVSSKPVPVAPAPPPPEPVEEAKPRVAPPSPAKPASAGTRSTPVRGWSRMSRALYLRQMEVMFGAGIPLHRAARVLSQGGDHKALALARLQAIPDDLERGRTLSKSLERSGLFSRLIISAIKLGEQSGRLEAILRSLSNAEERGVRLGRAIISRLTYPLVVMAVMCAGLVVLGHVMGRVMASLPALEAQAKANPLFALSTKVFTSDLFIPGSLLVLVVTGLAVQGSWKNQALRIQLELRALSLPIVGPLLRRVEANSVASNLTLLVRSGLSLDRGLGLCSELVHTASFREALLTSQEELRGGSELGTTLRGSGLFPEDMVALVQAGEVSGSLEKSLETAAKYCADQVERTLDTALSVLEPLLIGSLGIAIGAVLLFTFVPVFNSLNTL